MIKGNKLIRTIKLRSKVPTSGYYQKNAKFIEIKQRPLGTTIAAINKIKANPKLLEHVLPKVIGIQPTDSRYGQHVDNYLDGFSVRVSQAGKELNLSLVFKTADLAKSYEEKIIKIATTYANNVSKNPTQEREYFKLRQEEEEILEDQMLDVALVENPEHYLIWRIARVNKFVANRTADLHYKHISFVLEDESETKRIEEARFKLVSDALQKYFEIASNKDKVQNVLRVLVKADEGISVASMSAIDRQKLLYQRVNANPSEFLNAIKDENLNIKATIENYIDAGILRRLPSSTVIVENGTDDIIGNNMSDVIAFFKQEANKTKLAKFTQAYKIAKTKLNLD